MKAKHEWKFDLPWHMVNLRDWFYMVNTGYIYPVHFLHVRVLGLRSVWEIRLPALPRMKADAGNMSVEDFLTESFGVDSLDDIFGAE